MSCFFKSCFKLRRNKKKKNKKQDPDISITSDITTPVTAEEIEQQCASASSNAIIENDVPQTSTFIENCKKDDDLKQTVDASIFKGSEQVTKETDNKDAVTHNDIQNEVMIYDNNKYELEEENEGLDNCTIKITEDLKISNSYDDIHSNIYIQKSYEIINNITITSDVFRVIEELEFLENAAENIYKNTLEEDLDMFTRDNIAADIEYDNDNLHKSVKAVILDKELPATISCSNDSLSELADIKENTLPAIDYNLDTCDKGDSEKWLHKLQEAYSNYSLTRSHGDIQNEKYLANSHNNIQTNSENGNLEKNCNIVVDYADSKCHDFQNFPKYESEKFLVYSAGDNEKDMCIIGNPEMPLKISETENPINTVKDNIDLICSENQYTSTVWINTETEKSGKNNSNNDTTCSNNYDYAPQGDEILGKLQKCHSMNSINCDNTLKIDENCFHQTEAEKYSLQVVNDDGSVLNDISENIIVKSNLIDSDLNLKSNENISENIILLEAKTRLFEDNLEFSEEDIKFIDENEENDQYEEMNLDSKSKKLTYVGEKEYDKLELDDDHNICQKDLCLTSIDYIAHCEKQSEKRNLKSENLICREEALEKDCKEHTSFSKDFVARRGSFLTSVIASLDDVGHSVNNHISNLETELNNFHNKQRMIDNQPEIFISENKNYLDEKLDSSNYFLNFNNKCCENYSDTSANFQEHSSSSDYISESEIKPSSNSGKKLLTSERFSYDQMQNVSVQHIGEVYNKSEDSEYDTAEYCLDDNKYTDESDDETYLPKKCFTVPQRNEIAYEVLSEENMQCKNTPSNLICFEKDIKQFKTDQNTIKNYKEDSTKQVTERGSFDFENNHDNLSDWTHKNMHFTSDNSGKIKSIRKQSLSRCSTSNESSKFSEDMENIEQNVKTHGSESFIIAESTDTETEEDLSKNTGTIKKVQCGDNIKLLSPLYHMNGNVTLKKIKKKCKNLSTFKTPKEVNDIDEIEINRRKSINLFEKRKLNILRQMGSNLRVVPIKKTDGLKIKSSDAKRIDLNTEINSALKKDLDRKVYPKFKQFLDFQRHEHSDRYKTSSYMKSEQYEQHNEHSPTLLNESDTESFDKTSEKMTPIRRKILDSSRSIRSPKYPNKNNRKITDFSSFYKRKPVFIKSLKRNVVAYVPDDENNIYKIKKGQNTYSADSWKYKIVTSDDLTGRVKDISKSQTQYTRNYRAASPEGLTSKFDDKFKKYAGKGRANGDLISHKRSTEWLRDAGIIGKMLTAEEATDAFKSAAGAKVALNKGDYRRFLLKLTKVKKLNYNDVYDKLCEASSRFIEG